MATTTTNFGWDIPQSTDLVKDGATAIAALGQDIDTAFIDLKGGTTGQVLAKASGTDLDFSWVAQDDSNAIQNAIVDAKGDLIAASAADTPARLAVGANGTVLTADSAEATGIKWAAPSSGALTLITSQTLSGVTSISVNNCFSSTYDNYKIFFNYTATSSVVPALKLRVGGVDNSTGYYQSAVFVAYSATTVLSAAQANAASFATRTFGHTDSTTSGSVGAELNVYSPFIATVKTTINGNYNDVRTSGGNGAGTHGGLHNVTASFDGFTITNGSAMTGNLRVYGVSN